MDSPSKMTAEQAALWARIAAFPLDEGPAVLTFARRLAKEAGWSSDYTGRVIEEYRRFLFLATVAGHTAVPSEQVDQAWHLHLTYTRSYWGRLCRETIGRQLHHEPTRGGSGEQAKFIALYDETLASYRRFFGVEPPADIWPDAAARFGPDTQHRLVNTARNWVVPKRLVRRLTAVTVGLPALLLVAASWGPLAQWVNPLNLRGPDFLKLYGVLFVLAVVAALLTRRWLRTEGNDNAQADWQPSIAETAVLAAGTKRAAFTALAALVHLGAVRIDNRATRGKFLGISTPGRPDYVVTRSNAECEIVNSPLEKAMYDAIGPGVSPRLLPGLVKDETEQIVRNLRERQLIMEPGQAWWVRFVPAMIVGSLLPLGVVKLIVGISRGRPVGLLVFALLMTTPVVLIVANLPYWRTRSGNRLLSRLRNKHARYKYYCGKAGSPTSEVGLAFALFGLAAINSSVGPLSSLRDAMSSGAAQGGAAGSGVGCGVGGGCGGGGGGCGGGGCGGGRCGGCGG
ncbi:MAG TPA: TIGR04222 domain-containing membrane protein [Pirellulales bacterium]|jgi:uncharacterized protein (TIGR04222 family)